MRSMLAPRDPSVSVMISSAAGVILGASTVFAEGGHLASDRIGPGGTEDHRQDQPLADQHLLDVLQFGTQGSEDAHQVCGESRPVGANQADRQVGHGATDPDETSRSCSASHGGSGVGDHFLSHRPGPVSASAGVERPTTARQRANAYPP